MRLRYAILARARVEWASWDTRLLLGAATVVSLVRQFALFDVAYPGLRPAFGLIAADLALLAPVVVTALAALIAGRDEEAGAPADAFVAGIPRSDVYIVQLGTAVALSVVAIASALAVTSAVGLVRGGLGPVPINAGRTLTATLLPLPVWAAFGVALGGIGRSRAKGLAGAACVITTAVLLERLAYSVPLLRWVNATTPYGLFILADKGYHTYTLPGHAPALFVVAAAAGWGAAAFAARAVVDRRRVLSARPARPRSRRTVAASLMVAPLFGWAAPTPFARVIPWQYSPTWVFDQATRHTPDVVAAAFIGALRRGDTAAADGLSTSGDSRTALGLLARAWSPVPRPRIIELDRHDTVAGTVVVTWHTDRAGDDSVRLCGVRFPAGWRIDHVTSTPSCGEPQS
jgi:hypothetical protein